MSGIKLKRSHSFGGCATCRRRHLKCDQKTPNCDRCQRSGLNCSFAPALRWLLSTGLEACEEDRATGDGEAASRTKQQLYTGKSELAFDGRVADVTSEDSRQAMSASLTSGLPSTVSAVLDQIDEFGTSSYHSGQHSFRGHHVGPFGVFGSRSPTRCDKNAMIVNPSTCTLPPLIAGSVHGSGPSIPATSSPNLRPSDLSSGMPGSATELPESLGEFLTSSLDTMQWGDLFQWDIDYSLVPETDSGPMEFNVDQTATIEVTGNEAKSAIDADQIECSWPEIDLSSEAPLLLKHFNEEVITQMGSLPINEKSAWRILNFPSAVLTLSQLTLLGFEQSRIKRANLANLFAVIAVSALHMSLSLSIRTDAPDAPDKSSYWKSLSERTYEAAKGFVRSSLTTECTLPSKAKYKDQLMAVAAVLATAVSFSSTIATSHLIPRLVSFWQRKRCTKIP